MALFLKKKKIPNVINNLKMFISHKFKVLEITTNKKILDHIFKKER